VLDVRARLRSYSSESRPSIIAMSLMTSVLCLLLRPESTCFDVLNNLIVPVTLNTRERTRCVHRTCLAGAGVSSYKAPVPVGLLRVHRSCLAIRSKFTSRVNMSAKLRSSWYACHGKKTVISDLFNLVFSPLYNNRALYFILISNYRPL
jgi:hypothetical protein